MSGQTGLKAEAFLLCHRKVYLAGPVGLLTGRVRPLRFPVAGVLPEVVAGRPPQMWQPPGPPGHKSAARAHACSETFLPMSPATSLALRTTTSHGHWVGAAHSDG